MVQFPFKLMINGTFLDGDVPRSTSYALNTKRERYTYNYDGIKIRIAQVKSQGDSSFPTDGHKAILKAILNEKKGQ